MNEVREERVFNNRELDWTKEGRNIIIRYDFIFSNKMATFSLGPHVAVYEMFVLGKGM